MASELSGLTAWGLLHFFFQYAEPLVPGRVELGGRGGGSLRQITK